MIYNQCLMVNLVVCFKMDYLCWVNLEICEVEVNGEYCIWNKMKKKILYKIEKFLLIQSYGFQYCMFIMNLIIFFVVCVFGIYGFNCENQCNCKGEMCDLEIGFCLFGCLEGCMGFKCD